MNPWMNHTQSTKQSPAALTRKISLNTSRIYCCSYATNYPNAHKGCFNSPWSLSPGNPRFTGGRVCQLFGWCLLREQAESAPMQCCGVLTEEEQRWSCEYKLCTQTGNLIFQLSTWTGSRGRESVFLCVISTAGNIKSCRMHSPQTGILHMCASVFPLVVQQVCTTINHPRLKWVEEPCQCRV